MYQERKATRFFFGGSSFVWGGWAGQKPWAAHHLSRVIIRLTEARSLNTSWRIYYWYNSLLRVSSLAWCTLARIWVKITSGAFSCWQESDVNTIIEFRSAWNAISRHLCPIINYTSVTEPWEIILGWESKGKTHFYKQRCLFSDIVDKLQLG